LLRYDRSVTEPTYDDAQRALLNARALRDSLTRAVETARQEATLGESEGPSGWLGPRLRHPLWSLGTIVRMPMRLASVRAAAARLENLRTRSEPLPLALPQRAWTDARRDAGAMYWLGPVTIRHRMLVALLCQPSAQIEARVTVAPGAGFRCACGVAPRAWAEGPPAIDFTIQVASAAGAWSHRATRRLDVARRIMDRRWHDVRIDLTHVAGPGGEDVIVTLSTAVSGGAGTRHADALFGEPRLVWPRR
jgi:hypothetical protein